MIKLYKTALISAAISAILGFSITLLYLITKEDSFIFLGIAHLIPTIPYHIILLLILANKVITDKSNRSKGLQVIFIMLLNIPLSFICFSLII